MTTPGTSSGKPATLRLAVIGLLAVGVAAAIYVVGRVHTPDYTFSLFGQSSPLALKSLLASVALGLAAVQVLLALWIYRKLPLAGRPPRAVPLTHRIVGVTLVAVTLPVAVHCLIAYGVKLTSARVAVLGAAGRRRDTRDPRRRALVQLRAVVLQRLPAAAPVGNWAGPQQGGSSRRGNATAQGYLKLVG